MQEESRSQDTIQAIRRQMDRFIDDNDIKSLSVAQSEEQVVYNRMLKEQMDLSLQLDAARGAYESLKSSTAASDMTDEENAYIKTLPQVATRQEELRQLDESRRSFLAKGMQSGHPMVREIDRRRDTVQYELDRAIQKELGEMRALQLQQAARNVEALNGQLAGLQPVIAETANKLKDLTQKLNDYERLKMDLEIASSKQQRADDALDRLNTLSKRDDAIRVRTQVPPGEAEMTSPSITLVPLVTFLVTGLVAGVLVLREMLDQRVRSPQDLKLLPDAQLLGLIPHSSEDPNGRTSPERIVEEAPTGLLAESYRQVRTAVLSKMDRRGYKSLVCVSAQPEAGTSTVVQNLAMSMAFNGREVLILDANFRRPYQHRLMECPNERGLIDVLSGRSDLDDVLVQHHDSSLTLLPTGQAGDTPPEILEGAAFRNLLSELESRFDLILIDAPPALLTSDSQLLSKHVDAIAAVVQASSDKRGMLGRMLSQLDGQRADVLGAILNGVKSSAGGYFRKSYEDFYRYREVSSGERKRRGSGSKGFSRSSKTKPDLKEQPPVREPVGSDSLEP